MADKNIGSLPQIADLADDSLLVAEQQGSAGKITGKQLKDFAQRGVDVFVAQAKASADAATKSAQDAAASVGQIGDSVTQAQNAAQVAEEAKTQAEQAKADALSAQTGATNAQATAEQAKADAQAAAGNAAGAVTQQLAGYVSDTQAAKTAAEAAKAGADTAKTAAEQALAGTQTAQQAAESAKAQAQAAQQAAEVARTEAQAANTTATEKATEAAQSAATAQEYSGKPPIVQGGNWWTWNATEKAYKDTGKRAVLGFDKVYDSVAAMEADKANQPNTTVAIISSGVDDPDNAKLYIKNGESWEYLADLSGFTGVGVQSIDLTSGNHANGTTDTYTITLTDGNTYSFTVYNGADGQGAGDMLKSVYDPQNKNTDIFAYVDDAVSGVTINTDATPTQGSANPIQSGGVYTALSQKQDTITGQQGQVVGFDAEGNAIAQAAPDTGVTSFNGRKGEVSPGADDYSANMIKFTDGQTFQQKYDSGELVGPPGQDGATGPTGTAGADGAPGQDATINGVNALTLEAIGNLTGTQSGSKYTIDGSGKADKVVPSAANNIALLNASGNLVDSGKGIDDIGGGGIPVVTTSGTGAAYTATVSGVTELMLGLTLIIVPHTASTTTSPTLNVNGLGEKKIGRNSSRENKQFMPLALNDSLKSGVPVLIVYTQSGWAVISMPKPIAPDVNVLSTTNYTTSQVRGISLQTSAPSSIGNGLIVGVYST